MTEFALGLDFGTESGRALLVDVATGREVASAVYPYADGTPLCFLDEWKMRSHAWVKLWKHHAAQPEADRITALARERNEPWLTRYGGKVSSEWGRAIRIE